MVDISVWMNGFLNTLESTFGERVWFVGLQGSYGRGEATEDSDIDVVVIFDEILASDIETYNSMLDTLPNRELICGFVSGKDELLRWEPSDLFQFYYDTKPIIGSLDELLPLITDEAIDRAIQIGVCNIYHGCVHNMLHEKSQDVLKGLYKSAFFVVQAIAFKQKGKYFSSQRELLEVVEANDKIIIDTFLKMKSGMFVDFQKASEALFAWAKETIKNNISNRVYYGI